MSVSNPTSPQVLRIYGNLSVLEMARVLLAADSLYADKTELVHGSVMALWGEASELASLASTGRADIALNTETQALRGSVKHPDLRFIFTVADCPYRMAADGDDAPVERAIRVLTLEVARPGGGPFLVCHCRQRSRAVRPRPAGCQGRHRLLDYT